MEESVIGTFAACNIPPCISNSPGWGQAGGRKYLKHFSLTKAHFQSNCTPNFVMQVSDVQQGDIWDADSLHHSFYWQLMRFFYCVWFCARIFKQHLKKSGQFGLNPLRCYPHCETVIMAAAPYTRGYMTVAQKIIQNWSPEFLSFNIFSLWWVIGLLLSQLINQLPISLFPFGKLCLERKSYL